jgi:hypothetical protein
MIHNAGRGVSGSSACSSSDATMDQLSLETASSIERRMCIVSGILVVFPLPSTTTVEHIRVRDQEEPFGRVGGKLLELGREAA